MGIDFAYGTLEFPNPFDFVCRYLCPPVQGKQITKKEALNYDAMRLPYVLVWEDGAENALGGGPQGQKDGAAARTMADGIGWPTDQPIYVSIDFDIQPAQAQIGLAYADGFRYASSAEIGTYGGTGIIATIQRAFPLSLGWQAESTGYWSDRSALVHLLQTGQSGSGYGLASYDIDQARAKDFGQWYSGINPPKPPTKESNMSIIAVEPVGPNWVAVQVNEDNNMIYPKTKVGSEPWSQNLNDEFGPIKPGTEVLVKTVAETGGQLQIWYSQEDGYKAVIQATSDGVEWGENILS